ncbi:hypothetical protein ACWC9T_24295 [Kitasatospora sp. NPDC001159]
MSLPRLDPGSARTATGLALGPSWLESRMNYRGFVVFNVVGGVLRGAGVTVLGHFLGRSPFVRDHIEAILVGIVLVSVIPVAIELLRARRSGTATTARHRAG